MTDAPPVFVERAPHEKGFGAYFTAQIAPRLAEMETERRRRVKWFWLAAVFCIGILCLFAFAPLTELLRGVPVSAGQKARLLITVSLACAGLAAIEISYGHKIKGQLLPVILKFFGPLDFDRTPKISLGRFDRFDLLPKYDRYAAGNEISGSLDGTSLFLSQLNLTRGRGSNSQTVFHGIVILLLLDKPFAGKTIVKSKFGFPYVTCPQDGGLQSVHLEDVVFSKWFEVYSSDQIEARCLLTPDFMERVMQLATLLHTWNAPAPFAPQKHLISCCFTKNDLFLAIPCAVALFETGDLFRSAYDLDDIRRVLRQISLIKEIFSTLRLNRENAAAANVTGS